MVQSACRNPAPRTVVATDRLGRPNCPGCGRVLFVAEQSWFNMRGRIDHVWLCDDCGQEFVTSIRLGLR